MFLCLRSDSWRLGLLVFMELLQGRSETPESLLQSSRSFRRQGLYWERCGDDNLWGWIRLPTVRKGYQRVQQHKSLFLKAVISCSLQGARDAEKNTVQQHCHYVETWLIGFNLFLVQWSLTALKIHSHPGKVVKRLPSSLTGLFW